MSDTIDRQAAIEIVDRYDKSHMILKGKPMLGAASIVIELEALPSAQPETHEERTETHACDLISRQQAIDALCDNCDHVEAVCPHYPCKQYIAIENLPSEQPEQSDTSEFWRKRADYYSDMCFKLIADMGAGVKIEAVKIDETGITFTKKKPPTQQEINCSEIPNSSDTISRQLAIDVLDQIFGSIPMEQTTEILTFRRALRELPPAQPEQSEPEELDFVQPHKKIDVRLEIGQPDRSLWFRIGEICVDESKGFISSGRAVEKIRELLREAERREE